MRLLNYSLVKSWNKLFVNLIVLMLSCKAMAFEEFTNVNPLSEIGSGDFKLKVKIVDPVTQENWINKPYHLIIYDKTGKPRTGIYGNTDINGFTVTVKSTEILDSFAARPKMQAGQYPFNTKFRFFTSDGLDGLANTFYINFFEEGAVFAGVSDTRGDGAEVGFSNDQKVTTKILGKNWGACDWQVAVPLLNKSIESTPDQRVALIKQIRNLPVIENNLDKNCIRLYDRFPNELNLQMLFSAASGDAALLNEIAPLVVSNKAKLLMNDASNLDDGKPSEANYKLLAILNMLNELVGKYKLKANFIDYWADESLSQLNKTKAFNDDDGLSLKLAEKLIADQQFSLANKFNSISKATANAQETDKAMQLIVDAMILKSTGDNAEAQRLFEDANNWLINSNDTNILDKYRAEFKAIPLNKVRISPNMIADAKGWCPEIVDEDKNILAMFPLPNQPDSKAIGRFLTLDALLSHGTVKPGKVMLPNACFSDAPPVFELTKQEIKQLKEVKMLGAMLVFPDERSTKINMQRMQLVVYAWLQAVQLSSGFYTPVITTEKINIGF